MNQPVFSIVIPLFNKEKYIGRTIDSILSQKFGNFEIIIVNDGSTDSSLTQLLPFELFSKKFCLNISELGLEIV